MTANLADVCLPGRKLEDQPGRCADWRHRGRLYLTYVYIYTHTHYGPEYMSYRDMLGYV